MAYRTIAATLLVLAAASLPALAADDGAITTTKCKNVRGGSICESVTAEKPAGSTDYGPPGSKFGTPQDPGHGPPGRAYNTR